MAVTSNLCLSCSASAALWANSLASSSAIWAFSASRSAVSSDRSCRKSIWHNVLQSHRGLGMKWQGACLWRLLSPQNTLWARRSHQCFVGQSSLILQLEKSSLHLFLCSFCFLSHLFFSSQDLTLHLNTGAQIQSNNYYCNLHVYSWSTSSLSSSQCSWQSTDLLSSFLLLSLSLHLLHFDRVHLPPPHEQIMVSNAQL